LFTRPIARKTPLTAPNSAFSLSVLAECFANNFDNDHSHERRKTYHSSDLAQKEMQDSGDMFVIFPLTNNYHIYVIPESHNIPQDGDVVSISAIKLTLQTQHVFLGVGSLVCAGGEVNTSSVGVPLVLKHGIKCYDIALHAYAVKGMVLLLGARLRKQSE
jgi:hypothetical protein